jgi:hypothetical protein
MVENSKYCVGMEAIITVSVAMGKFSVGVRDIAGVEMGTGEELG